MNINAGKSYHLKKIVLIVGLLLVCATLLLNERVLAGLLPDHGATPPVALRRTLLVADALFALIVIFLLVNRKPKAKILLDLLVGIGFTLLLLLGIEFFFYYLNRQNPLEPTATLKLITGPDSQAGRLVDTEAQSFFQPDDWLGYKPIANGQVAASRKKGEKLLYDVVYSSDEYGRRVTPAEQSGPVSHTLLFFGGSFAFGEGVNDDETMPYYLSQAASGVRVYNYGVGGYGPQQMLAKLQSGQLAAEIEEEGRPILVYLFIKQHIGRAIGSMWIHNRRGELMPYYYLEPDGTLTRKGNFVSGRPVLSVLYGLAGKSQTLEYFGVSFPLNVGDPDLKTAAKIFQESRDLFAEQFKSDQFYLLIYPSLGFDQFLPYLQAANIKYLDYSGLPEAQHEDFWLGEGHPTAKAHRLMAEKLAQDLGLQENREK